MSIDEQRVREFAFQIWESEGRPEGQAERHWQMAIKLAQSAAAAPGTGKRAQSKTPPAANPAIPAVKKAAQAEKPALLQTKPAARKPAAPKASAPKPPTPKAAPKPRASKPPLPSKKAPRPPEA